MAAPKLTRAAFEAWLEEQSPRKNFATNEPRSCPIAHYVCGADGSVMVFNHTLQDENEDIICNLPLWAHRFVVAIDDVGTSRVTAARALRILREMPK